MQVFHILYRNTQGTLMRILNAASRRGLDLPYVLSEALEHSHKVTLRLDVNPKQIGQLCRDWHAIVDGKPAPVLRGDNTLLSILLPSGARQVDLTFDSPTYRKGKLVSLLALLAALAMAGIPAFTGRKPARD